MKIGLWGSYDKGNFGDDLMAFMISTYLKNLGNDVILYSSTKELEIECSCYSVNDIDSFVNQSDIVVIGGGGMLINNSVLRFIAKKVAFDFEVSFFNLLRAIVKYNKKLVCISIGGDGSTYLNNPFKRRLFNNPICLGGTVRLESDLNTVDSNLFSFIPDIVLQTPNFFDFNDNLKSAPKKRIVLNLKQGSEKFLDNFLSDYSQTFEIITFGSHLPNSGNDYELVSNTNHYVFNNLKETVCFLSQADFIISSKLHVGVTGLSFGVPFISYRGPGKAVEFLKSSNLDTYVCNDFAQVDNCLNSHDPDFYSSFSNYIYESSKHFDVLKNLISN
ncbi:polysaccharide pyruvyl transferase family protein [Algoriphagus vanfongensis]|uniref:polysaccharide pyruvyl transferase family protein n=1 Tax=Algoriphagus vanfongensis TaxID=426371 RepID=UPI0004062980|nr:polysaccharide pyruvyl transferase family protein [Algoriphagus vanfongensis]